MKKSHSVSSSSIHILYNQAVVRGLSVRYVPDTWIGNLQDFNCTEVARTHVARDTADGIPVSRYARRKRPKRGGLRDKVVTVAGTGPVNKQTNKRVTLTAFSLTYEKQDTLHSAAVIDINLMNVSCCCIYVHRVLLYTV